MSRKRARTSPHGECEIDTSNADFDVVIEIPNPNDSGSDDSGSDSEDNEELSKITYKRAFQNYSDNHDKLEKDYVYNWIDGEKCHSDTVEDSLLLKESEKKTIQNSEPVKLFENFFSDDMKYYIIEATKENGFCLKLEDLNTFIGIIILSAINKRKSQRDYWSKDPYLSLEVVSSAMSRDQFEEIKTKLKYSKAADEDSKDKAWRVRKLLQMFQKNIQLYGFWKTALSVDEMMAKSYARTSLKQFIRGKPIRFGLKFWGLCNADGYLLNLDLYCGKDSSTEGKLAKCSLGSRVVIKLLEPFFKMTNSKSITQFHLYFDNYFTSFDLILHLEKLGLRCTGTIRENRVKEKNVLDKKSPRGTFAVKHDKVSGINYISVVDSKIVSIASSAAGVTPLLMSKRYSSTTRTKSEIPFPHAFHLYNKFMGGVDIHDGHCNNVLPSIRSKKWTWVVFIRLIQASITNSVVLFNATEDQPKKVGTKEFALSIAKHYIEKAKINRISHKISNNNKMKPCSKCPIRTNIFCHTCNLYFCRACSKINH